MLAVPEHAYSVQIEDGSAQLRFSLLTDANLAPGAKLTLTLYPGVSNYVYCEHCVVPYECSLDATTQQCAFVLQPCLYDGQNHDNSLLVVSATGITQVLLYTVNYESIASTPEPLKSGVSLANVALPGVYRHYTIETPSATDKSYPSLIVELYVDADQTGAVQLFLADSRPAGTLPCYSNEQLCLTRSYWYVNHDTLHKRERERESERVRERERDRER